MLPTCIYAEGYIYIYRPISLSQTPLSELSFFPMQKMEGYDIIYII